MAERWTPGSWGIVVLWCSFCLVVTLQLSNEKDTELMLSMSKVVQLRNNNSHQDLLQQRETTVVFFCVVFQDALMSLMRNVCIKSTAMTPYLMRHKGKIKQTLIWSHLVAISCSQIWFPRTLYASVRPGLTRLRGQYILLKAWQIIASIIKASLSACLLPVDNVAHHTRVLPCLSPLFKQQRQSVY